MEENKFVVKVYNKNFKSLCRCYVGYAQGEYYTTSHLKHAIRFTDEEFYENDEVQDLLQSLKYELIKI